MSTRCNIIIKDDFETIQLYRHLDGYPDGESGVLAELPQALFFAWPLPRMEAADFAAAIVRAWKTGGGNISIDGIPEEATSLYLHGDIAYLYEIEPDKKAGKWKVECYKIGWDYVNNKKTIILIYEGHIVLPEKRYDTLKSLAEKEYRIAVSKFVDLL